MIHLHCRALSLTISMKPTSTRQFVMFAKILCSNFWATKGKISFRGVSGQQAFQEISTKNPINNLLLGYITCLMNNPPIKLDHHKRIRTCMRGKELWFIIDQHEITKRSEKNGKCCKLELHRKCGAII